MWCVCCVPCVLCVVFVVCVCRPLLAKLAPYLSALQQLRAHASVKATVDPVWQGSLEELTKMVLGLDTFIQEGQIKLAEADAIKDDDPDDVKIAKMTTTFESLSQRAVHHMTGAQAAKTRFTGLLQKKV